MQKNKEGLRSRRLAMLTVRLACTEKISVKQDGDAWLIKNSNKQLSKTMIYDEYTNEELNNAYFEKPVSMRDNIKFCCINKTSRRTRKITIYEYETKITRYGEDL